MRRFILSIALFIPLMVALPVVNYLIDPAHLFSMKYYEQAGLIMKNGDMEMIGNCNESNLIKEFLKHKGKANVVVAGSSRTLILNSDYIGDTSMLNLSTSGSDLEDLIASYGLYYQKFGHVKKLLIGVDPWMFNGNRHSTRFHSLIEQYNLMAEQLHVDKEIKVDVDNSIYSNLYSPEYFQNSLLSIIDNGFKEVVPKAVSEPSPINKVRTKQGSIIYPTLWQTDDNMIELAAKRYISEKVIYGMDNYKVVSKERVKVFEKILRHLSNQGVEVVVYLSPYHPIVWDYFEDHSKYHVVMMAEIAARKISQKFNIEVIGSYNPYQSNLVSSDFYDGMHPNYSGIGKIFSLAKGSVN